MKNVLFSLIAIVLACNSLHAQTWVETDKKLPLPNNNEEYYGHSIAVDGNYAVVGATGYNNEQGCAYVLYFNGSEWVTMCRLTADDGEAEDYFGKFVSISGDIIAVGAPLDDDNGDYSGSIYVFKQPAGGWKDTTQIAKLTASDGQPCDNLGNSVSISGDVIVSGVIGFSGSAYVFEKPGGGWADMTETAELTASDGDAGTDYFGNSVDISGDVIVVGAYAHDVISENCGAVYVFIKPGGGWTDMTQDAKLTADDKAAYDRLGYSVNISGDIIVAGAPYDGHGSAYVYNKPDGGWTDTTQTAKLTSDDGEAGDRFGYSLSISNDVIVVGASYDFSGYVFKQPAGGWTDTTQTAKLTPDDFEGSDEFGESVSISGDVILMGSKEDDNIVPNTGSVYIYKEPAGGWIDTIQTQKILSPLNNKDNFYGFSVDVDGNYAVVGEYGYLNYQGCAFVLYYNGTEWETKGRLTADDGANGDYFGYSVDISGGYIAVGAYKDNDTGSVYVFKRSSMTQIAKLTPSDGAADDMFGYSVSISGDVIVAGSYWDDDNGDKSGSAYVFERPAGGWEDTTQRAKLTASDGDIDDWFGQSVSISDDIIVVGARRDDDNGNSSGSAYVYEKPAGGWADMTQTAKLTADDGAEYDYFGISVSIFDSVIVAGAHWDDDKGNKSGSAYVFEKPSGGWTDTTQTAKLTASDGAAEDYFGSSISISNNVIIIGAYLDDDNGNSSGSAYIFHKPVGGWTDTTQTHKLIASDGKEDDYFGISLSISGDVIMSGACYDDDMDDNSGSVFIFQLFDSVSITTQPADETNTCSGTVVNFSISGNNITHYQWQVSSDDGNSYTNLNEADPYSGTQSAILTLTTDSSLNENLYRCVVSNPGYNDTSCAGTLIIDSQAPNITSTHNDRNLYANANCEAILPDYTGELVVTDNCDTTLDIIQSPVAGSIISGATNIITLTVADDYDNFTQVNFNVAVIDNTDPEITCPADLKVMASSGGEYTVEGKILDATAEDNCNVATLLNDANEDSTLAGEVFNVGVHVITWTATDENANTDQCSVTLTVEEFTGISEQEQNGFCICPNPVSDKVVIHFNIPHNVYQIILTDLAGKTLFMSSNTIEKQQEIDMSNFAAGLYLLHIRTDKGSYSKKLIKD